MNSIEQVKQDRNLIEQGRHEGMQWMRDHLIEKLTHDMESNDCDCQCDALGDVVKYLNGIENRPLAEVCQEIYEASGQSAVFDYINANHPEVKWKWCEPCEYDSPTSDGACLVCGSMQEQSPHQHVWQTDMLSDTYETICGICQAVKETK